MIEEMMMPWDHIYRRLHEGINDRLRTFARPLPRIAVRERSCSSSPSSAMRGARIVTSGKTARAVHAVFTGGEALLKPFTIELVDHAHKVGLFLEVPTHGYWDDRRRSRSWPLPVCPT